MSATTIHKLRGLPRTTHHNTHTPSHTTPLLRKPNAHQCSNVETAYACRHRGARQWIHYPSQAGIDCVIWASNDIRPITPFSRATARCDFSSTRARCTHTTHTHHSHKFSRVQSLPSLSLAHEHPPPKTTRSRSQHRHTGSGEQAAGPADTQPVLESFAE